MQTKPFVAGGIDHMPAGLGVKGKAVVRSIDKKSAFVLRCGLVLMVFWIGCLKFTAYESKGIFNHASHSPLLAWAYRILDVRDFSRGLGLIEIALALLIAAGPVWPKLSIVGSLGGIGMFLTTLSFVITTPGVWQAGYGFPALSRFPEQFLIKDVLLLGAAIWTLADSLRHVADGESPSRSPCEH
jgi:reactive chlorine resistance protein C